MKKILLIIVMCLLACGCSKHEKNITINIYENSDTEIKQEQKEIVKDQSEKEISTNNQTTVQEEVSTKSNQSNNINKQQSNPVSENNNDNTEQPTLFKVTDKVKDTYNNAKDWYNANKDELKNINSDIIENDKNTINVWIDSGKSWYEENKDALKQGAKEIYENDKQTINDLYNKIKN